MNDETRTDEQLAAEVRTAVACLNEALTAAARSGLAVHLRTTSHQMSGHRTSGSTELVVVEVDIFRQL